MRVCASFRRCQQSEKGARRVAYKTKNTTRIIPRHTAMLPCARNCVARAASLIACAHPCGVRSFFVRAMHFMATKVRLAHPPSQIYTVTSVSNLFGSLHLRSALLRTSSARRPRDLHRLCHLDRPPLTPLLRLPDPSHTFAYRHHKNLPPTPSQAAVLVATKGCHLKLACHH